MSSELYKLLHPIAEDPKTIRSMISCEWYLFARGLDKQMAANIALTKFSAERISIEIKASWKQGRQRILLWRRHYDLLCLMTYL